MSELEHEAATCTADVLSDPKSRALYDEYGLEGMQHMSGAAAGKGNARQVPSGFATLVQSPCITTMSAVLAADVEAGWLAYLWLLQAWDEFKPYKKENKHTKARDRARASAFSMDSDEGTDGPISTDQESQ